MIGLDCNLKEIIYDQDIVLLEQFGFIAPKSCPIEENVSEDEILKFPSCCSHCQHPCETNMKIHEIPYFQKIILMTTVCDFCNYKNSEVKTTSPISSKGTKLHLEVTELEDLSKDVLKSDTCSISIPEIDLTLQSGTLGSKYTTIEGLISNIYDQLLLKSEFFTGDSAEKSKKDRFTQILEYLKEFMSGKRSFNLILDDPASNSFIQNNYAPDKDPKLTITTYNRTDLQDEELGINDMKTENYT